MKHKNITPSYKSSYELVDVLISCYRLETASGRLRSIVDIWRAGDIGAPFRKWKCAAEIGKPHNTLTYLSTHKDDA